MYFVYVLYSAQFSRFYIGSCEDPEKRLKLHNGKKVPSTRRYVPWKMIYTEEYETRSEAMKREKYLKSGWGRQWLKKNVPQFRQ